MPPNPAPINYQTPTPQKPPKDVPVAGRILNAILGSLLILAAAACLIAAFRAHPFPRILGAVTFFIIGLHPLAVAWTGRMLRPSGKGAGRR